MICYPSPDLSLETILSRSSTYNPFGLVFALTCTVTVGPYIDRCVPFQMIFLHFHSVAIGAVLYRFPLTWGQNKLSWMLLRAGVMILALVCAVLGLCAVFDFHNSKAIPNLYSLDCYLHQSTHSSPLRFSICATANTQIKMALSYNNCELILGHILLLKSAHVWMGDSILILSISYANLPPEAFVANSLGVFIVAFGLVVLKFLSNQKWKRPEPTSEDMSYRVSATNLM
uniref:Lysosomal membrane ascorbate-dependent ferrireductase CYB561A3 n=1 Tax=Salmo trutta TaxID=8032 RepID=A0A673YF15_SALTR